MVEAVWLAKLRADIYWYLYFYPENLDDQIFGVMWCSSGIIFGSCCDGDLLLGQVKCVPLDPILEKLEEENHHHQVL